jgi:uncharacterized membrane protein YfcA
MQVSLSPNLVLHLCTGTLAILSGAVALSARKGLRLHRAGGRIFAVTMLITSATGVWLAIGSSQAKNILLGLLAFYLAATGWRSARKRIPEWSWPDSVLTLLPVALVAFSVAGIARGVISIRGALPYLLMALFCIAADLRTMTAPGQTNRLARHLWRMSFVLLLAAKTLFLGQAKVFPEMLRKPYLLATPLVLICGAMLYWLRRVLVFTAPGTGGFHSANQMEISPVRDADEEANGALEGFFSGLLRR